MLPLDVSRCAGKQTLRGVLAGICINCARRTASGDQPHIEPPALILRSVWVCKNRIVPAGA
jgi:hypothetical protein